MRRTFFCFVQLLLIVSLADAQPATSAIRDFDLLGRWAIECSKAASPINEHTLYSLTSVDIIWVFNDFGPDYDGMVYRVVEAKRVAPDKLSMRQILATDDNVVLDIVLVKDSDRIRIWSSRVADGTILVKDGTAVSANGRQTHWTGRCGERRAAQPG